MLILPHLGRQQPHNAVSDRRLPCSVRDHTLLVAAGLQHPRIESRWQLLITSTFFLPSVIAATTSSPPTPINTCCPPGHFLAIEDLQESRQDPEGVWSPEDITMWHLKAQEGPVYEAISFQSSLAQKWWELTRSDPASIIQETKFSERRQKSLIAISTFLGCLASPTRMTFQVSMVLAGLRCHLHPTLQQRKTGGKGSQLR